ncbi:hypothetical protein [Massilia antarctica]|nr:hypothetical protein [Massilia sp. H27-R4]MCY0916219.1 hypothetical protein [Massilia sp. H27-R4]
MNSIPSVRVEHDRVIVKVGEFLQQCAKYKRALALAVVDNFTIGHMAAALWLKERHEMSLSIDNLYSLVEFWPTAVALPYGTKISPTRAAPLPPGKFNPMHLIEYFEHEAPVTPLARGSSI